MEWRTLTWLPAYEISSRGDIRRCLAGGNRGIVGKELRRRVGSRGYLLCALMLPDKTQRNFLVHRLVCEAFNGPAPEGKAHAAHGDGDKLNNRASNLRWASPKENEADKLPHGRRASGERCGAAKLSAEQIVQIRNADTSKRGDIAALAVKHGVTGANIGHIRAGRTWRNEEGRP